MPENKQSRKKQIREIAESYMKQLGLNKWKLTCIYLGIPDHMVKRLQTVYPEADRGFYACIWVTAPFKFVMAINDDVSSGLLPTVIGHEITHILLDNLFGAVKVNRPKSARRHLETACNRVGRLLARNRKKF